MDIKNTEIIVKNVLYYHPETRDSDDLLYLKVAEVKGVNTGVDFATFLKNRSEYNMPPFETVRRTRQKIQAAYSDLRGNKYIEKKRKELEKEYKIYALKENC